MTFYFRLLFCYIFYLSVSLEVSQSVVNSRGQEQLSKKAVKRVPIVGNRYLAMST
jgi:hypothetical protein